MIELVSKKSDREPGQVDTSNIVEMSNVQIFKNNKLVVLTANSSTST